MYVIKSLTLYDVLQEATQVHSLSHSSRALGKKTRKKTLTLKKKFRLITFFSDRFVLVINQMYVQQNIIVTIQQIIIQTQHEIFSMRTHHHHPHHQIIIIIIIHIHHHMNQQNEFYVMENDVDLIQLSRAQVQQKVIHSKFPKLHHQNPMKQCSYHRRNYLIMVVVPRHPHRPVSMMKMKQIRSQERKLS